MIWIGTSPPSESSIPGVDEGVGPEEKRLASDWAVAMPSRGVSLARRVVALSTTGNYCNWSKGY